jgi:hypothetical protein
MKPNSYTIGGHDLIIPAQPLPGQTVFIFNAIAFAYQLG